MGDGVRTEEPCLQKAALHDRHIHANGDRNNNMMERFNGGLHTRIKTMRGREGDTCMMLLLQTYYNHIRPHTSLGGGMTPGGAAGIRMPDRDMRTVLIRHARLHGIRPGWNRDRWAGRHPCRHPTCIHGCHDRTLRMRSVRRLRCPGRDAGGGEDWEKSA